MFLLNTIRKKLIFTFILMVILPIVIISFILYSSMGSRIAEDFNKGILQNIGQFDGTLTAHLIELENSVTYLSEQSEMKNMDSTVRVYTDGNPGPAQEMEKVIESEFNRMIKSHPDYSSAWLGTEYGGFQEYKNDGSGVEKGYDPRQRGWYKAAKEKSGTAVLIEPYLSIHNTIEVTAARTITDESGKVIGVAAAAMELDKFSKLMENINTQKTGSLLLALPDGTILSDPKHPELSFEPISKLGIPELDDLSSLADGSYEMDYNGHKQLVNILTSPVTGWRYVGLVEYNELLSQLDSLRNLIMIASLIIIAAAIAIATVYANRFSKPIRLITSHAQKVAAGDITETISYQSRDELGALTKHFNEMIESLREIVNRVKETSSEVKQSAESVMTSSADASLASNQIAVTMSEVAAGTSGQVTNIQEGSIAMEEMSNAVSRVAESASSVAELAVSTSEQAAEGAKRIENSVTQMTTIYEVTNETVGVVNRLVMRTQEIDQALETITNIADQTNLLALNAAIESARAGEHGRGFAVVADEVRKLAEQSRESANEINELLRQIQEDTSAAVQAMERGQTESSHGMEAVREAGAAFEQIVKGINDITFQMQEVSAASEEMSAGIEEINASLEEIAAVSKQVADQTNETAAAAQEQAGTMDKMTALSDHMKLVSEDLENLVSQFKTEKN
ncbi:methyl-accepting chemotaxis protein [Brevibacillus sp. B_LB10_24]|uniref:methyl-accepting chemotaxis protein n=1 Tax=Brevibacillus sp. B_LB10_24 TaxID=3380645 RepID=UPI0038B71BB5